MDWAAVIPTASPMLTSSAVALGADSRSGVAGHYGTDSYAFYSAVFYSFGCGFEYLFILLYYHLAGLRILYIYEGGSAYDSLLQRLDDLLAVRKRSYFHSLVGSAVVFPYDNAVGNVYQSSGQVT